MSANTSSVCARILPICLAATGVFASRNATAETVHLESTIDTVTLFPEGATLHRIAKSALSSGEHMVELGPLPQSMIDASLHLDGTGQGAVIQSVTLRTGRMMELMSGELEQLEGEVAAMDKDLIARRTEQAALVRRVYDLQVQNAPAAMIGTALRAAQDLRAIIDHDALRFAQRSLELASMRAEAERAVKFVLVEVSTASEGDLNVNVSYQVPTGASWTPAYGAHLDEQGGHLALDLFASVQQNTGENWDGVRLALLTASPSRNLARSVLEEQAIELEPSDEPQLTAAYPSARSAGATAAQFDEAPSRLMPQRAVVPPPTPIETQSGHAQATLLSARIEVPGRITLRSGAPARRYLASHQEIEVHLEHEVVPRASVEVFMNATFENHAAYPLLPAETALFLAGEFVGTAQMPATNVGDEIRLPFGIDSGVTLTRSLADRKVLRVGDRDATVLRYEYSLVNHRRRAASVTVVDQIPVSHTAGLSVHTSTLTRALASRDTEDAPGVIRWVVQATPDNTAHWMMGYTVSAPHNRTINGAIE